MQKTTPKGDDQPTGMPCYHCAVRPDVACEHRPADPYWTQPPVIVEEGDDPRFNFRTAKRSNYISGGGNYAAHKLKRLREIIRGRK